MLSTTEINTGLLRYIIDHSLPQLGKDLTWLSKTAKINFKALKCQNFSIKKIIKIASILNLDPRELIQIQNKYIIYKILEENMLERISEIRPNLGEINKLTIQSLFKHHLRSNNITTKFLAKHINISEGHLVSFFSQTKRIKKMKCIDAGKIGDALGTDPKIWLDLQNKQLLKIYIDENPFMSKYFEGIYWVSIHPKRSKEVPVSPGNFLKTEFIDPSGISKTYWANYFCIGKRTLERILNDEIKMSFKFIALLVKIFDTSAYMWIEMQNEYLSYKYKNEYSRKFGIKLITPRLNPSFEKFMHPGKFLVNQFLNPMNLSTHNLAKHIKVHLKTIVDLTKCSSRINPTLAIKLGQAFHTSPFFWLDLQMEFDLQEKS